MATRRMRSNSKASRFFFGRVFPLPFMLAGAAIVWVGVRDLQHAQASTQWPTATGQVRVSEVEYRRSRDSGGTYHARVVYDFEVEGTPYTSDRVAFGDFGSSNPGHARGIVNRYPEGDPVVVFFPPQEPGRAVLEPGVQLQTWFMPAFGLVFLVTGLGMALFLPAVLRRQAQAEAAPGPTTSTGAPLPPPTETWQPEPDPRPDAPPPTHTPGGFKIKRGRLR